MENQLAIAQNQNLTAFSGTAGFEAAQRMAKALVSSDLVPEQYRGPEKIGNALIALEMSQRIGASPLAVMQNLHIIHGRPSWSSSFIIAALNACGRFSPLRFAVEGTGDDARCYAYALDKSTGDTLEGPPVSIAMAKAEGWYGKNGSKWRSMPELMLRYRAAAFFGRLYAPDVLSGMHSADEVEDIAKPNTAKVVLDRLTKKPEPIDVEPIAEETPKPAAPRKPKEKPLVEEVPQATVEADWD